MKVLGIRDIVRKEGPIYYRRVYSGVAVLEFLGHAHDKRVEFAVEIKPTGAKEVSVNLTEDIDYPLVPLLRALRDFIQSMERSGALP